MKRCPSCSEWYYAKHECSGMLYDKRCPEETKKWIDGLVSSQPKGADAMREYWMDAIKKKSPWIGSIIGREE